MDAATKQPLSDTDLLDMLAIPADFGRDSTEIEAELSEEERQFQAERKSTIGGTDSAAICGFSSYRNAWDVAAEKRGLLPPWRGNERTEIGRLLEGPVAQAYSMRTGRKLEVSVGLMRDSRSPFLGGHPDGLVVDERRGVEIKTVEFGAEKWSKPGEPIRVPSDYYVQCQHYMMITGYERWDLVALFGLSRIRIYELTRNDRVIEALRAKDEEFWHRYIEGPELPAMEPSDRAKEWLEDRYPEPKGETIVLATQTQAEAIDRWRAAKEKRAEWELEEERWKIQVQQAIGDATGIVSGGTTITWKKNKDTVQLLTDWRAVAEVYREQILHLNPASKPLADAVIQKFTKATTTKEGPRVLRVKEH